MSVETQIGVKIVSGQDKGKIFPVKGNAFLGTASTCLVRLTDPALSDMHAKIRAKSSTLHIADLTPEPDMKVNGMFAKARLVTIGDNISIADTVLEVIDINQEGIGSKSGTANLSGVTIVAEEESTITQIIRPSENDTKADDGFYAEPADETSGESASVASDEPEISIEAQEALKKFREKTLYKPKEEARSHKRKQFAVILILLLILGAGVTAFLVNRQSQRRKLDARYNVAKVYADANPEDLETITDYYNAIIVDAIAVYPKLARYLRAEVRRMEDETAKAEEEFNDLLKSLDKKADRLVAQKKYESAVAVYKIENADMAAEVAEARYDRIKELKQDGKAYLAKVAKDAERDAAIVAKAQDDVAKKSWAQTLKKVAESLVAGDDAGAINLVSEQKGSASFDGQQGQSDAVIAVAKELMEAKKTSVGNEGIDAGSLTPIAQTVLSIIEGDIWKARSSLKKSGDHVLKRPLLKYVQINEDDMYREKTAMVAFANVWVKITGKDVTKIPKPEMCVKALHEFIKTAEPKDAKTVTDGLVNCRKKHAETMFVKRYASVFAAADQTDIEIKVEAKGKSAINDGKVIQVSGDNVFVELAEGSADPDVAKIGIFKEKTLFVSPDKTRSVASRVNVLQVIPFKALSDKQVVFVKPEGLGSLKAGQSVLVRGGLAQGDMLINNLKQHAAGVVYQSDFSTPVSDWKSNRASLRIEDGRLSYSANSDQAFSKKNKSGSGDIVLEINPTAGPLRMKIDLKKQKDLPLTISVGNVDFMLGGGTYKNSSIYIDGRLSASGQLDIVGISEYVNVTMERGESGAKLSVGGKTIACHSGSALIDTRIDAIRFYGCVQVYMDNAVVERVGSASLINDMAGISTSGKEILFLAGNAKQELIKVGAPVYLSIPPKNEKKTSDVIQSKVSGVYGKLVTCIVPAGKVAHQGTTVSFSRTQVKESVAVVESAAPYNSSRSQDDVLLGVYGKGRVHLRIDGMVQDTGYISAISEVISHPETKEPLAAEVTSSARSVFKQSGEVVVCRLGENSAVSEGKSKGVLLSSRALTAGNAIDVVASRVVSPAVPLPTKMKKKSFWQSVSGDWELQKGRIISSSETGVVPVVLLSESYSGNAQFDFDLRLGEPVAEQDEDWARSFMVELFFPSRQSGVTMGIDNSREGVLVAGRTLSLISGAGNLTHAAALPMDSVVVERMGVEGTSLKLKGGSDYKVRVRRVGNAAEMLVNGKRVAYVQHADMKGEVHLLVGSAYGTLNLGRTIGMSLPAKCELNKKEPTLGEFGYVVAAQGKQITIDSDMHGLEVNAKVSVMKMGNLVQGEKSTTIILDLVAQGIVSEIGPRTARVLLTEQVGSVQRGMKVFSGEQAESLLVTDKVLHDLEQGF